jgi:outer membrane protein OmpA-like peptidoglycan-associated protein
VDEKVAALAAEKSGLAAEIAAGQEKLAELSQEHAAAAEELGARREREEKFRRAKELITPADGEVLYNPANDIVLRLSGLSFESGKSDIRDTQMALLAKVKEILKMFPDSRLIVEGHTDTAGDPGSNQRLSERRAIAVMQYLRESLVLPAERISALGYGADRPVASNQTPEGRAKNRRIDIVIMR